MNIFALDDLPRSAARFHCDSHVVKMPLETAQLLCTAHHVLDGPDIGLDKSMLYKPTHINHPCAVWLRESMGNYIWTYTLFQELSNEYKFRYGKTHKSYRDLHGLLAHIPENIPQTARTPFALAMPDEFHMDRPVDSYREYYRLGKQHLHAWTKRDRPEWLL